MLRFTRIFLIALVILAPIGAFALEPVGNVAVVSGDVTLMRAGKQYALPMKTPLYHGDTVITPKNGFAKLIMKDDSVLTVGASSRFAIEAYVVSPNNRYAKMNLFVGRIRAVVAKFSGSKTDYKFFTPTAVAGVRGTTIDFEFDEALQTSILSVLEGEATLESLLQQGNRVAVGRFQQAIQRGTETPAPPQNLTPKQVQKLSSGGGGFGPGMGSGQGMGGSQGGGTNQNGQGDGGGVGGGNGQGGSPDQNNGGESNQGGDGNQDQGGDSQNQDGDDANNQGQGDDSQDSSQGDQGGSQDNQNQGGSDQGDSFQNLENINNNTTGGDTGSSNKDQLPTNNPSGENIIAPSKIKVRW